MATLNALKALVNAGISSSLAASVPQLKPVETAATFQKVRNQLGQQILDNEELRYTYCDAKDFNLRPFANLFQTFRIPTTIAEKQAALRKLGGTGLATLANVDKFIAVEIPRNKYGEMVDGKSIELTIPQTSGGTFYSVTCFGSFYGFNPDLNNQVSDANAISSLFSGVEPTEENDFNTNIAYLFSNDIKTPQDYFITNPIYPNQAVNIAPGQSYVMQNGTGPLVPGKVYQGNLVANMTNLRMELSTALGNLRLQDVLENTTGTTFRVKYQVNGITLHNENSFPYTTAFVVNEYQPASTRQWSAWSSQNRFPTAASGSGKAFARLSDAQTQLLVDEPVGIAYLDKGFILITNPTLIANFDLSEAQQFDVDGGISPYSQAAEDKTLFTQVFFPSNSSVGYRRSALNFRSVATEYNQGYTCLAMPDEFTETTNPTYRQTYPAGTGNVGQQPLLITEVGLYNKFGELVAIAKPTKPLEKTKTSVAVFNIGLKI